MISSRRINITIIILVILIGSLLWLPGFAQESFGDKRSRRELFPIDPKTYLMGRFRPDTTRDFVLLPAELSGGRRTYLRTSVAEAVGRLIQAALKDSVPLWVLSATRSYDHQRAIWNSKFSGARTSMGRNLAQEFADSTERCLALLEYSSAPGTSRHHWGTDVDLNSTDPAYWRSGEGVVVMKWLQQHAGRYGFIMAYPPDREHGYRYEPWHWSYQPLSRPLLRNYYRRLITPSDLDGFLGAEVVRRLPWWEWYVNGVDEGLR
ncbi:MAG: M15 family metallopeptidase [Fidelibacterota bacterium]|nr:MAG: M15 family metallopeptidase [Candidatus Neomarinimicrobiota bacterium]